MIRERCQCPTPAYAELDDKFWFMGDKEFVTFTNTDLHFKSADRHCEKCGAALCEKCEVKSTWGMEKWELRFPHYTPLCHTCSEVQ